MTNRLNSDKLANEQKKDRFVKNIIANINTNKKFSFNNKDLLVYDKNRIVIPETLIDDIIWAYHSELGHCGISKMFYTMKEKKNFKNMYERIKKRISKCQKYNLTYNNLEIESIIPLYVFHLLTMADYIGPLEVTSKGNKHIFTFMDLLSKQTFTFAVASVDAETTLNCLKQIVGNYGPFFFQHLDVSWLAYLQSSQ
eukprot:TRINITY_DN297_c2_g1_i8.p1 TRINITY_DN297_c2_g1~~TRINITY_DN297_c2_g1_i8.p1  ORF type:complete len:197 (+),score=-7.01 TRINITY_DN297_c2_g1_i8:578-1168(+)